LLLIVTSVETYNKYIQIYTDRDQSLRSILDTNLVVIGEFITGRADDIRVTVGFAIELRVHYSHADEVIVRLLAACIADGQSVRCRQTPARVGSIRRASVTTAAFANDGMDLCTN
jgi:hypothetical protein